MTTRRVLKVAEAIREVVSFAILTEVRDPRVSDVTVTYVEVSGDLRQAKVHVSIMGDDTKQRLCMKGLQSSAGFLQQKVAKRIDTRFTPRLTFELDMGVKRSIEVSRMLRELLPQSAENDDALPDDNPTQSNPPDAAQPLEDQNSGNTIPDVHGEIAEDDPLNS